MAVPDKQNLSLLEEDYTSTSCHHKWILSGQEPLGLAAS